MTQRIKSVDDPANRDNLVHDVKMLQNKLSTSTDPIFVVQSATSQIHSLHALISINLSDRDLQVYNLSQCSLEKLAAEVEDIRMIAKSLILTSMDPPADIPSMTPKQQELIKAVFPSLTPQEKNAIATCIRYFLSEHEQEGDLVSKLLFLLHRAVEQDGHHDIADAVMHFMTQYHASHTPIQMRSLCIDWTYRLAKQQPGKSIITLMIVSMNTFVRSNYDIILTDLCDLITPDMSNTEFRDVAHNLACIDSSHCHDIYCLAKELLAKHPHLRVNEVINLINEIWHNPERDVVLEQTLHLVRNVQDHGETAVIVGHHLRSISPASNRQQFVDLIERLSQNHVQWNLKQLVPSVHIINARDSVTHSDHSERESIMCYFEVLSARTSIPYDKIFSEFHLGNGRRISIISKLSQIPLDARDNMVQHIISILPSDMTDLVTGDELVQTMSAIDRLIARPRFEIAWTCLQRHITADFKMEHRLLILSQLVPILRRATGTTSDEDITTQVENCIHEVQDKMTPEPFPFK